MSEIGRVISLDANKYSAGAQHFSVGGESIAANTGLPDLSEPLLHQDLQFTPVATALLGIQEALPHSILVSTKIGSQDSLHNFVTGIAEISQAKEYYPNLIFGGVYPTFAWDLMGDDVLRILSTVYGENTSALKRMEQNLTLVRRQGEVPTQLLLQQLQRDGHIHDYSGIPNTAHRVNGEWIVTPHASELYVLNNLELPSTQTIRQVLDHDGVVWAEFTRGCLSHCTYCAIKGLRGEFSTDMRAPERVVEHLQQLIDLGVKVVSFTDDDFPIMWQGDDGQYHNLGEYILAADLKGKIQWTISTRASHIFDPNDTPEMKAARLQAMQELKQAGLYEVFIGAETFAPEQAKRYGIDFASAGHVRTKKTHACTVGAIETLRNLDISLVAGFIPLDPLMTDLDELRINMEGLETTGLWRNVTNPVNTMRVQRGTPYATMCERAGLAMTPDDYVFFNTEYLNPDVGVVAETAHMWSHELVKTNYGLKFIRNSSDLSQEQKNLAQYFLEKLRLQEVAFIKELSGVVHDEKALTAVLHHFEKKRLEILSDIQHSPLNSIATMSGALATEIPDLAVKYTL